MDRNPPVNTGDMDSILVWEESTGHRANKPELLKSECLEPVLFNERSHHNEKTNYYS